MKGKMKNAAVRTAMAFTVAASVLMPANVVKAAAVPDVGLEAAKAAAIAHSGLSADQVSFVKTETDMEDGHKEYELEFITGNFLFKYEINAQNGNVKKVGFEVPKALVPTIKPSDIQSTPIVTRDKAIEAALRHAGFTQDQIKKLKVEGEYDDGILDYDIEFKVNGVEYNYEINAQDGSIISCEVDSDDNDYDDNDWDDNDRDDDYDKDDDDRYDDDDDNDDDDDRYEHRKDSEKKDNKASDSRDDDDDDRDDDDDD